LFGDNVWALPADRTGRLAQQSVARFLAFSYVFSWVNTMTERRKVC